MELIIIYCAGIIFAMVIGGNKNRPFAGLLMGILFSWLGVLIMLVVPKKKPQEFIAGKYKK